ncbi:MAG: hypothetical protein ACYTFG_09000 [Planctomycetota bacterium]
MNVAVFMVFRLRYYEGPIISPEVDRILFLIVYGIILLMAVASIARGIVQLVKTSEQQGKATKRETRRISQKGWINVVTGLVIGGVAVVLISQIGLPALPATADPEQPSLQMTREDVRLQQVVQMRHFAAGHRAYFASDRSKVVIGKSIGDNRGKKERVIIEHMRMWFTEDLRERLKGKWKEQEVFFEKLARVSKEEQPIDGGEEWRYPVEGSDGEFLSLIRDGMGYRVAGFVQTH